MSGDGIETDATAPASAPFRELFVELPRALFETLQGIGEQAVRNAPSPALLRDLYPTPRRTFVDTLREPSVGHILCHRFGWGSVSVIRAATEPAVDFRVFLACGHRHRIRVSEMALEDAASPVDVTLRALERGMLVRSCYCVQREEPRA